MEETNWRTRILCVGTATAVFGCIAAVALATAFPLTPGEHRLTTAAQEQVNPAISGEYLVWQDTRNWNGSSDDVADIYCLNLKTGVEALLDGAGAQGPPDVSGTNVVYESWEPETNDPASQWMHYIIRYNLVTKTRSRIVLGDEYTEPREAAIDGYRVAYIQTKRPDPNTSETTTYDEVWVLDMLSNNRRFLTKADSLQSPISEIDVSGDHVVYRKGDLAEEDNYMIDLSGAGERRMTSSPGKVGAPVAAGTKVVWTGGDSSATYGIYCYDTTDASTSRLTAGLAGWPGFDGERVVYVRYDGLSQNVFSYDMGSKSATALTTGVGISRGAPVVSGSTVVWSDNRTDSQSDLYAYVYNDPIPPTTITSSTKSNAALGYGAAFTVSGILRSGGGAGLAGKQVILQSGPSSASLKDTTVKNTSADGSVSFTVKPSSKTYYRIRFAGGGGYLGSGPTAAVSATPRAYLTTPAGPSKAKRSKAVKFSGAMKPKHTSGAKPVLIYRYRSVKGKWKQYGGAVLAKVANSSSANTYSVSVKLPVAGKWGLCASHADAGHAATRSSYKTVTVK